VATEWFYYSGDQRLGPVGSQQLKDLASKGQLRPDSLIWKEGMTTPQPASRVKGLFEAVVTPPALPHPAPSPNEERVTAPDEHHFSATDQAAAAMSTIMAKAKATAQSTAQKIKVTHKQPGGVLGALRNLYPSDYVAEVTFTHPTLTKGAVFKELLHRLPDAKPECDTLVANNIDRAVNVGFSEKIVWDRFIRIVNGRIMVAKQDDEFTIRTELHQSWSTWAVLLLVGLFLLVGWFVLAVAVVKVKLISNRTIQSAVQQMLADVAAELQRRSAVERLTAD